MTNFGCEVHRFPTLFSPRPTRLSVLRGFQFTHLPTYPITQCLRSGPLEGIDIPGRAPMKHDREVVMSQTEPIELSRNLLKGFETGNGDPLPIADANLLHHRLAVFQAVYKNGLGV